MTQCSNQEKEFEKHLQEIEDLIRVEYHNLSVSDDIVRKDDKLKNIFKELKEELLEPKKEIIKDERYDEIEISKD